MAWKVPANPTLLTDYSLLVLIRAGIDVSCAFTPKRRQDAEREQRLAAQKIDELLGNAPDAELEVLAKRVASNEALQGGDYTAEYESHLQWLKDKRAVLNKR